MSQRKSSELRAVSLCFRRKLSANQYQKLQAVAGMWNIIIPEIPRNSNRPTLSLDVNNLMPKLAKKFAAACKKLDFVRTTRVTGQQGGNINLFENTDCDVKMSDKIDVEYVVARITEFMKDFVHSDKRKQFEAKLKKMLPHTIRHRA